MSETVVETFPALLNNFTFRPTPPTKQNCQVINQKISHKGTCQSKDVNDYKACQPNFQACSASPEKRVESCGNPKSKGPGACGAPPGKQIVTCIGPNSRTEGCEMALEARCLEILQSLREPLAEYQEKSGLSKTEQYGFITLMTALCQHAYTAVVTIFTMLYNLIPLLEGFLYLARFTLDKLIDICRTRETGDKVIKALLFSGEMLIIVLALMVIFGFILVPVGCLFSLIFSKVWSMVIVTT